MRQTEQVVLCMFVNASHIIFVLFCALRVSADHVHFSLKCAHQHITQSSFILGILPFSGLYMIIHYIYLLRLVNNLLQILTYLTSLSCILCFYYSYPSAKAFCVISLQIPKIRIGHQALLTVSLNSIWLPCFLSITFG